ncbi:hypothetical protein BDQ17DRAFT_1335906 [Cyathus striatus]|nr:hypothetical protein BDQ17DRAFT_1335906 [Cyathus striatus]
MYGQWLEIRYNWDARCLDSEHGHNRPRERNQNTRAPGGQRKQEAVLSVCEDVVGVYEYAHKGNNNTSFHPSPILHFNVRIAAFKILTSSSILPFQEKERAVPLQYQEETTQGDEYIDPSKWRAVFRGKVAKIKCGRVSSKAKVQPKYYSMNRKHQALLLSHSRQSGEPPALHILRRLKRRGTEWYSEP